MNKHERVLIIDGLNTYIRSFLIVPITNDDGEHFGGVFGFLRSLRSMVEKFKPTEVLIAWDGKNGGLFRKTIYPEYKATRRRIWERGSVRAFDFLNEYDQKENFSMQITRVREYLDNLPIKFIQVQFEEADDVIAHYVKLLEKDDNSKAIIIASTDADFKQLVSEKTVHWNPIAKKLTTHKNWIEDHGYPARNYIFTKVFTGDHSDNIKGIHRMGEKTLLKLFPNIKEDISLNILDILEQAEWNVNTGMRETTFTKAQQKKFELICEKENLLKMNWRLMQLFDVEITPQTKEVIEKQLEAPPNIFGKFNLRKLFMEDKLESQVRNFNVWIRIFSGLQVPR